MLRKMLKLKYVLSVALSFVMTITLLNGSLVKAEETNELYPYTIFAASYEEGAISINADNFCVNGDIATNGTITSTGNMNINGVKTEYVGENMIYIFQKLDTIYFSDGSAETYGEDYFLEELNINITHPLAVAGDATMIGNINIDSALKVFGDISLQGEVKNTDDSIIFSKYGDIVIDSQNVNLNGLIYAPFGEVIITAQNLTLNNVVIIADRIKINCPSINANYSSNMAEFVGNASEKINIPYEEWQYMVDENKNGLPDFFEDMGNWDLLEDTDGDLLPDDIEAWLGSSPDKTDSDGDGLDDLYEVIISLTDPASADSDGNEILDGDEDWDFDNLTTLEEYQLGTHPLYADSDGDEYNDYEEAYLYFTNPNKKDTDGDGADDKWENENGFDPNTYDDAFLISAEAEGKNLTASVTMEVSGNQVNSLSVEAADDILLLNDTVPGYIGSPFQFEIDGAFEQAEISFTFDAQLLQEEDFVPAIYYYNEETQLLEELSTTVDGNTATTVTTHFSVYVLLNKTTYESAWQTIKTPNRNSDIDKMNIAFVVDTSSSMGGTKLATAKTVIQNFIGKIRENNIETEVSLVSFSNSANIVCELSNDYDTFLQKLDGLKSMGGTSIYNGLIYGINTLGGYTQGEYDAIILLTDGYDSSAISLQEYQRLITNAVLFKTEIYTIGIGAVNESLLIALAEGTGGEYFFANNAAQLYEIYEEIQSDIIDYTTDSNNDGISDYYTKLLCDGTLRIGTQCDIFTGVSYEVFNEDDDYDKDGKANGDEFEIRYDSDNDRVYVYLNSNPVLPGGDFDGVDDKIDTSPLDASTGFLIYETKNTDVQQKNAGMEEREEDYRYADKSIDELRAMKHINWADFLSEEYCIGSFMSLMKLCSTGEMENVAMSMANHFLDGTGTDYSNTILTKNISSHENTDAYVNAVANIINGYIMEHDGDISGLAYHVNDRENCVMVNRMKGIYSPNYDDPFSGLGICVHGLYGNRFEVTSYKFDGENYEYTLRFTFYDIFGLDSADVVTNHVLFIKFGSISGFRSWYILQHCNLYGGDYQPYFSYMTFERTITGSIQ